MWNWQPTTPKSSKKGTHRPRPCTHITGVDKNVDQCRVFCNIWQKCYSILQRKSSMDGTKRKFNGIMGSTFKKQTKNHNPRKKRNSKAHSKQYVPDVFKRRAHQIPTPVLVLPPKVDPPQGNKKPIGNVAKTHSGSRQKNTCQHHAPPPTKAIWSNNRRVLGQRSNE